LHPYDVNLSFGECKYERLLNKEDPLDQLILDLVEKGELKVGIVEIKPESRFRLKKYISPILVYNRKHKP
jgi:hypothetical protein